MEGELFKWTECPSAWKKTYCVLKENFLHFHCSQEDYQTGKDPVDSIDLSVCDVSEECLESNQFALLVYPNSEFLNFKLPPNYQLQPWIEAMKSVAGTGRKTMSAPSSSKKNKEESVNVKQLLKSKSNGDENQLHDVGVTKSKFDKACARLSCTLPRNKSNAHDGKKQRKSSSKKGKTPTMTVNTKFAVSESMDWNESGPKTFFSSLTHTFSEVKMSIRHMRNGVPMISFTSFINACSDYALLFDRIDNNVLLPIKADMVNGISRLEMNKTMSILAGDSLLAAIQDEVEENKIHGLDSTAQTLIWLLRTLKTMNIFAINLMDMHSPTFRQTTDSFLDAYERVMIKHHGWLAQKMFKAGMKFVSPYETIVRTLIEPKYHGISFDDMEALLSIECIKYNMDLSDVVEELTVYFSSIGLEV